jgi:GNAT superfamily N-acetyltransferase
MDDCSIRRATVADAGVIAHHRAGMFRDMGRVTLEEARLVEAASRERTARDLASGVYRGWLAEIGAEVVAGAGVVLHDYDPAITTLHGRPTAYILNVYTEPAYRRRGVAGRLIREILTWCAAHDIPRASLHASAAGRAVYERIGFSDTNELRTDIRPSAVRQD